MARISNDIEDNIDELQQEAMQEMIEKGDLDYDDLTPSAQERVDELAHQNFEDMLCSQADAMEDAYKDRLCDEYEEAQSEIEQTRGIE